MWVNPWLGGTPQTSHAAFGPYLLRAHKGPSFGHVSLCCSFFTKLTKRIPEEKNDTKWPSWSNHCTRSRRRLAIHLISYPSTYKTSWLCCPASGALGYSALACIRAQLSFIRACLPFVAFLGQGYEAISCGSSKRMALSV